MQDGDQSQLWKLSALDAAAVDALLDRNGAQPGAALAQGAGELGARTAHVRGLLSLLATPGETVDQSLIDATLARVQRAASGEKITAIADTAEAVEAQLSADDIEAMDAYMASGHALSRVPASLRDRAAVVDALAARLRSGDAAVDARAGAVMQETMSTLARAAGERTADAAKALSFEDAVRSRGVNVRWADLVSVAAVLVMGVSALFPVLSSWSTRQVKTSCASNFAGLGQAFGQYADDYAGSLPVVTQKPLGGPRTATWWNVGQGSGQSVGQSSGQSSGQSNSANVFALHSLGYAPLATLACAGNEHAVRTLPVDATDWQSLPQISYSYYVMFGRERPSMQSALQRSGSTVILADRSPVVQRALAGEPVFADENSPNHAGCGQWVLKVDASAAWANTPTIGQDNIWLPANLEEALRAAQDQARDGATSGSVELLTREAAARQRAVRLQGTETPASADDSFVGP